MNKFVSLAFLSLIPVAFFATTACSSSNTDEASNNIDKVISNLQVAGVAGATIVLKAGDLPAANGGPSSDAMAPSIIINGGSIQLTVNGQSAFTGVVLSIPGTDGYYLITLPEDEATVNILGTLAQELDRTGITFHIAAANGSSVGDYVDVISNITVVGTGDVQVSISWDVDSDVDLHVIDPSGDEVFYGSTEVTSGGMLDLDSNAGCDIDHIRNENITWTTAPAGTYMVLVDYYESCGVEASNYVVTVHRKGQDAQTFTGQLTGSGDTGGAGSGSLVTTFTIP